MEINEDDAITIMFMADMCFGEGLLHDDGWKLVQRIVKQYPYLKGKFSWMFK